MIIGSGPSFISVLLFGDSIPKLTAICKPVTDMGMKPIIFNHLALGDIQKTRPPLPHV